VEYLRSGQKAKVDSANLPALVLKGNCEMRQDVVGQLQAGDPVADAQGGRFAGSLQAMADSTVLRLPREVLGRLMGRWNTVRAETPPERDGIRLRDESFGGGKVICWMPLSEGILSAAWAQRVAATIFRETGHSVLRLQVERDDGSGGREAAAAGGEGVVCQKVAAAAGEGLSRRAEKALIRGCEHFDYVMVEVGREVGAEVFRDILRRSHVVYPILRQNGESLFEVNLLSRELRDQKLATMPVRPLVVLGADEKAHGLSRYIEESSKWQVHLYLRETGDGGNRLAQNLRRVGREICGRQVGLALSSGAARGLSHIGVIQVLEENGLEVDVVAGSSMGAYVAAVWGAGYDGRAMEQFARELEGDRGLWSLLDFSVFPRRGFLLTERVRRRLKRTIGSRHFSDLVRPIRVVATRLDSLERSVFSSGDVVEAVLASIAIPGICVPVQLGDISYIDGGICDPMPVEILREMGVGKIIAVNTIATPEALRICEVERPKPQMPSWGYRLNSWVNPFARGNVFDTILRSIHAAQTQLADASCRHADVVLRPHACEGRWNDFGHPGAFISAGREAAWEQLPALRALFASPHENPSPKSLASAV